ncbi:MAG: protein kinase [Gammaproteobacteria bacterium]|nr:protein kinase [Gammaproteobacteria bacterium]
MSVRVMIIDEQAAFRSLLMHHVTTGWPDAIISAYDPTSAGHLPDEFSGAGNDLVLLGDQHGEDRDGIDALRRFAKRKNFPPIVYISSKDDEAAISEYSPDAYFRRDAIEHGRFISTLEDVLLARRRAASTTAIEVEDLRSGAKPRIKGYRVLDKLSATEHSGVYLAESEASGQSVALKVLRQVPERSDSVEAIDRFLQEYETIAEVRHPNVVRIYDLGISDEHAHIVMEYLDGGDLRYRINSGIDERQAVAYLRQLAGALAAIHDRGVLHRDVKPSNVMLRADGSIALIDFGLAKRARLRAEMTDTGEIFGTPYYMSPEQGHGGRVDQRSDIYSLGVIFYEMLTGARPYQADSAMGVIYHHAKAPLPRLPATSARYQPLLDRMMAKNPEERLQHAAEIDTWL